MKRYLILALNVFFFISLISNVSAWGPNTHFSITNTALSEENNTLIAQIINNNLDGCYAGLEYADVGIFYYYTDFKVYAGLHNYNTVDELLRHATNDKERAFAYCWKIHLAEDAISHNYFIPAAIKSTKLPNYVIHPIKELSIEGHYLNPVANRLMERHSEYDNFVKESTGKDWSSDAEKLNIIMGGGNFYSKAYTHDSTTWWGNAQNYMYKFIALFVTGKSSIDYYTLSVDSAKSILRGETPALDPSGEVALFQSDNSSQLWLYLGTFVIFAIIIYLGFRWNLIGWSRNRFKFR